MNIVIHAAMFPNASIAPKHSVAFVLMRMMIGGHARNVTN